ncbi:MAG: hypothetical protein ACJAYG_001493 [Oceanicoccus sp.]|jgi:hypothetical protein
MASINQYRARFLAGIDLSAKLKWLPALSSKPWLHFLLLGGAVIRPAMVAAGYGHTDG